MRIYENKGSKRRFLPTVARSDYFAAMGLLAFILKESDVPSGMRPVTRTFLWSRSALPITALLERIIAYRKTHAGYGDEAHAVIRLSRTAH